MATIDWDKRDVAYHEAQTIVQAFRPGTSFRNDDVKPFHLVTLYAASVAQCTIGELVVKLVEYEFGEAGSSPTMLEAARGTRETFENMGLKFPRSGMYLGPGPIRKESR